MKPLALNLFALFLALGTLHATAQDTPDGKALYQQYCAQCHGPELHGGNAQSMVDGIWNFGAGGGSMTRNIKHGITHLGMPAYESTMEDEQIKAIVDYILAAEKDGGATPPPIPTEIQTHDYIVNVEPWVTDLELPWGIAFTGDDTALITERPGRLRLVEGGNLAPNPIEGTPEVLNEGQSGLLDVAVDPDYGTNGWIYLAYGHALKDGAVDGRAPAMTRLVRGHVQRGKWTNEEVVFEAAKESYLTTRVHFGSRIAFDADGFLYFSIGERGQQDDAQNLSLPNGKIHRINRDGSVPRDNPFVDVPNALPSIYTFGNRNPQGLAFRPDDNILWASEHGPMGGDELNTIRAGKNYGWPLITYGRNYNGEAVSDSVRHEGLEQPSYFWRPSIAVCGINICTGKQFPRWKNAVLATGLRYASLSVLQTNGDKVMHEETILKNVGRVRHVAEGPDGAIYVLTNSPDAVLKLSLKGERSY